MIHTIEVKFVMKQDKKQCKTAVEAFDRFTDMTEHGNPGRIHIMPHVDLIALEKLLKDGFPETEILIKSGVRLDCYGARSGETAEGLTVHLNAERFPDRWTDSEGDEIVNPLVLISENNGVLVSSDLDGDEFLEAIHEVVKYTSDNTYNYAGHDSESVCFAYDMDYSVIEGSDEDNSKSILVAKFHHGGDPRGNYGQRYVFKFDSMDDLYSVISPMKHGGDE